LAAVTDALKAHNATVTTASAEKKLLDGFHYAKGEKTFAGFYTPELTLNDITVQFIDTVDAIVFMPGEVHIFTPKYSGGPDVKRIVERAIQKKKVIGAIGGGVLVLGQHGFLEHADASTVPNRQAMATQIKVKTWKSDPKIVIDLPFITAGEFNHSKSLVDEVMKAIPESVKR